MGIADILIILVIVGVPIGVIAWIFTKSDKKD